MRIIIWWGSAYSISNCEWDSWISFYCCSINLCCTTVLNNCCNNYLICAQIMKEYQIKTVSMYGPNDKLFSVTITEVLAVLIVTVCLSMLIQYHWKRRRLYYMASKIAGPPGLPIIGNALLFIGSTERKYYFWLFKMLVKLNFRYIIYCHWFSYEISFTS